MTSSIRPKQLNRTVNIPGDIFLEDDEDISHFITFEEGNSAFISTKLEEAKLPQVEIASFSLSMFSYEELETLASMTVTDPGFEGINTINSRWLGTVDSGAVCLRCSKDSIRCTGHVGLIKFATPINHPAALDLIVNVLKSVCNSCACLMLSEKEMLDHYKLIREKDKVTEGEFPYIIVNTPSVHLSEIARYAGAKETCRCQGECWNNQSPECKDISLDPNEKEGVKPKYTANKYTAKALERCRKIVRQKPEEKPECDINPHLARCEQRGTISHENWNVGEIKYTYKQSGGQWFTKYPESILRVFDCISPFTALLLGFTDGAHPRNFIMKGLPVIPPCARAPVGYNDTTNPHIISKMYTTIVKINNKLEERIGSLRTEGNKVEAIEGDTEYEEEYAKLKCKVRDLILLTDSPKTAKHDVQTSMKQLLTGKYGWIRKNMMGKRVDFSARTVISIDPHIDVDEIMIPRYFADILTREVTVSPGNIVILNDLLRQGRLRTIMRKGDMRKRITPQNKDTITISIGDKVERPLQEGDYVIFTRQPVLHRFGFMAHKVKFWDAYTFGIHIGVTPPYNADFDGDEATIHVPRSEEAFLEMKNIMSVKQCILGDKDNRPIIAMTYDAAISVYKLTEDKKYLSLDMFDILVNEAVGMNSEDLLQRAVDEHILSNPPEYKEMQTKMTLRQSIMTADNKAKEIWNKDVKVWKNNGSVGPKPVLDDSSIIPHFISDAIIDVDEDARINIKNSTDEIRHRYDTELKDIDNRKDIALKSKRLSKRTITLQRDRRIKKAAEQRDSDIKSKNDQYSQERDQEINMILKIAIERKILIRPPDSWISYTLRTRLKIAQEKNPDNEGYKILGRIAFSALLPTDFWYSTGDSMNNNVVTIENGILTRGRLSKRHIGSAGGSIVHELAIDHRYSEDDVVKFISDGTRLLSKYISNEGVTVGLGDCFGDTLKPEKRQEIQDRRKEELTRVKILITEEALKTVNGPIEEARREKKIKNHISSLKNVSLDYIPEDNNLKLLLDSGTKGTTFNLAQIMDAQGQQFINGQRMPMGMLKKDRCLPYYEPGEIDPVTRGFCEHGFVEGIGPGESFAAHKSSRNNLMDTAIKTADIGMIQRRLSKGLEDIKIFHDGTVRNSRGKIYQFAYGDDGLYPTRLIKIGFPQGSVPFPMNVVRELGMLSSKYGTKNAEKRKFTKRQIDRILAVIPDIKSISLDVTTTATNSFKRTIFDYFKILRFKSTDDNMEKFMKEFIYDLEEQFKLSIIDPGVQVGLRASGSIGEPVTQLTLNTFHFSGSARNISSGIEAVKEFIMGTPPKFPSLKIIFDPYKVKIGVEDINDDGTILRFPTIEDLFILRRKFVHINVRFLVDDYEILQFDGIEEEWQQNYLKLYGIPEESITTRWYMRLFLNVALMVSYGVTPYDIQRALMDDKEPMLIIVPSPMDIGIIDLFPKSNQLLSDKVGKNIASDEDISLIFLEKAAVDELDKTTIQGIPGITAAFPSEDPVMTGIMREEHRAKYNTWRLWYNQAHMTTIGMSKENVIHLVKAAKLKIVGETSKWVEIGGPTKDQLNDLKEDSDISPLKYIRKLIILDMDEQESFNSKRLKVEILEIHGVLPRQVFPEFPPILPVLEASRFRYLETNGTNLVKILAVDDVLRRAVRSTNMKEILEILGVEALRSAFIQFFTQVLSLEGTYIDRRHISLLADYITSMGSFDPVTFKGMINHGEDVISIASLERASDYILSTAAFGVINPIKSVSSSITAGSRALIGNYFRDSVVSEEDRKTIDDIEIVGVDDANAAFDFGLSTENVEIPGPDDISSIFAGIATPDKPQFSGEFIVPTVSEPGTAPTISRRRRARRRSGQDILPTINEELSSVLFDESKNGGNAIFTSDEIRLTRDRPVQQSSLTRNAINSIVDRTEFEPDMCRIVQDIPPPVGKVTEQIENYSDGNTVVQEFNIQATLGSL